MQRVGTPTVPAGSYASPSMDANTLNSSTPCGARPLPPEFGDRALGWLVLTPVVPLFVFLFTSSPRKFSCPSMLACHKCSGTPGSTSTAAVSSRWNRLPENKCAGSGTCSQSSSDCAQRETASMDASTCAVSCTFRLSMSGESS
uniref:Expressed protein n=1 Tax=Schizophyllum commune (strain H4-8 / FGSC 9210) TaxID=578458 RepID=D8Q9Q5_SCHCM